MGWIMVPKKKCSSVDREDFRICHECGKRIMGGDAHIVVHNNSWVFHPECGIVFQARELKLEKGVARELKKFAAECKKKGKKK